MRDTGSCQREQSMRWHHWRYMHANVFGWMHPATSGRRVLRLRNGRHVPVQQWQPAQWCIPRTCNPSFPQHAARPCEGQYRDVCKPSCPKGYTSQGYDTCGSDGNFTGTAVCVAQNCTPITIENAAAPCTGSTGTTCTPHCKQGFYPSGQSRCDPNGEFACIAKPCKCVPKPCAPV